MTKPVIVFLSIFYALQCLNCFIMLKSNYDKQALMKATNNG